MALDVERVREIADRVAASSGLEVLDIEFLGGGTARMLRVFLDKPAAGNDPLAGVTHGDCANFSREFGTILDVEDVMPGSYTLEVSSPGLDRPLRKATDFVRFAGNKVDVRMRTPDASGRKRFTGLLRGADGAVATVEVEGHDVALNLDDIDRARLVPDLLEGKKR